MAVRREFSTALLNHLSDFSLRDMLISKLSNYFCKYFQDKVEKERKTLELLQNPDVSKITLKTCVDKAHKL